jgi:hypothetical protein
MGGALSTLFSAFVDLNRIFHWAQLFLEINSRHPEIIQFKLNSFVD